MATCNTHMTSARATPGCQSPFKSIKLFVFCQGLVQLALFLTSGYLKSAISTIERRYGFTSQMVGLLSAFNEVGNTILIVFVSFFGSRIHRPRFIGAGALLASMASLIMAIPHFLTEPYQHTGSVSPTSHNTSGLCQSQSSFTTSLANQSCVHEESPTHQGIFPVLLLGQFLLGVGTVPIQPFGISYVDDYCSRRNSPLYLGILLAVTAFGPALGFMMGSLTLRSYVDFDTVPKDQIQMGPKDPRWVGAWWLGFLVASCLLFLTSLPYLFFPRSMSKEDDAVIDGARSEEMKKLELVQGLTLVQFLKSFPGIVLRTLKNPVYLLVVLAQVFLSAVVVGVITFKAKFMERQFTLTTSFSTLLIGAIDVPVAVLAIVLGGAVMRRLNLSISGAARMCALSVFLCMLFGAPLIFIGCPTQRVAGIYPPSRMDEQRTACSASCMCPQDVFNPVCGSDGVEFRSPCLAGCVAMELDKINDKVQNYTSCRCVATGRRESEDVSGYAVPGTCGGDCTHLWLPFMVLSALSCFIGSFCQTPSFSMILRIVPPEHKSFVVGVQYMLFRVFAFLPAPVLYGSVIDKACILWGRKCGRKMSCLYYDLDFFRRGYLSLQVVFSCGGLLCFLLTMLVIRKQTGSRKQNSGNEKEETSL